jgi:uncharacterized damage-inducible protein DinB
MTEIRQALADQLGRTAHGEAWHGPSVRETLTGVTAAEAVRHPIRGAHSIWELVLHLSGAYDLVLRRIEGDGSPLTPAEDWPMLLEPTDENWQRAIARYHAVNARMREAILRFPIERLFEPIVENPPYSAFTQFVGLTQHDLFHAGQIMLLKRALKESAAPLDPGA